MQQKDIDSLREELDALKRCRLIRDKEVKDEVHFWENKYKLLQNECRYLNEHNSDLLKDIERLKGRCGDLEKLWQIAESALLDVVTEVKVVCEFKCFYYSKNMFCTVDSERVSISGRKRKNRTRNS